MKEIKRDENGSVIVPEGMIYIKEHTSAGKRGIVSQTGSIVVEHYRKKKGKKVRHSWLWRLLRRFFD